MLLNFFSWHYYRGIKKFLEIWRNFLEFFWNFFSIKLLAKTLFAHWRRDVNVSGRGFDIEEFFRNLILNIFSRLIGAIIRSAMIIIGLLFELLTLVLGLFLFFVWLLLPIVTIYLFVTGFALISNAAGITLGLGLVVVAFVLVLAAWRFYQQGREKSITEMSLEQMMKEPWFDFVWQRLDINSDEGRRTVAKNLLPFLNQHHLTTANLDEAIAWVARERERDEKTKKFWLRENLLTVRGIGKEWAYGFTYNLDRFSDELTLPRSRNFKTYLIGREKEIDQVERILTRAEENNILIVGEPGTGRKTVVRGFADFVAQGMVLPPLQHKRVLQLDLGAVIAGSANDSEIEARLIRLFDEAIRAGNIILVIDDFHDFVSQQSGLGKIDMSGLLMPYLGSRGMQLIGIVTFEGLHKNIESNPGLLKLFEKVEVKEPDEKNSLLILQDVTPKLEARLGVKVTYQALREIVSKASRYFGDVPMPERAIDLLDEAMVYLATKTNEKFLRVEHVDVILSEKTQIPIGEISQDEKEKLVNLEDILHRRVINQAEAIKNIASAMRRARVGIGEKRKPIGSFLFLGPTGVGKTETAKALAEAYFGSDERMIRFDMSEYQTIADISRLIGSQNGDPGQLVTQIRENPFSLVLFDEIEKAHASILNLFLQVLDEGWLTDAWGRKVSFRNCIIIATSNAGAELIREMVSSGSNQAVLQEKILDFVQREGIFKPELLNRFDGLTVFHSLSHENLVKIAELLLGGLAQRLAEQEIQFVATPALAEKIANLGYAPEFGARPMRRVIQDRVEDLISQRILSGQIQKGQTIEIRPEEI